MFIGGSFAFLGCAIVIRILSPNIGYALDSSTLTTQERKDLKLVMAGEDLDFSHRPPAQKILRAEFLERLLFETPEAQVPRRLIRIKAQS